MTIPRSRGLANGKRASRLVATDHSRVSAQALIIGDVPPMNFAEWLGGYGLAGERAKMERVITRQGAAHEAAVAVADLERIYRSLRLIRRAEEEVARIYPTDKIKSPVHLSIGQEAVSVGVCDVLRPDDVVAPTYRGHAAYLAKGGPSARIICRALWQVHGRCRRQGRFDAPH